MIETEIKFSEVRDLLAQVEADDSKVSFKRIIEAPVGGVSLLAFKAGQKLSEHLSPAELMVYVAEGAIRFTIFDTPHELRAGQFLLLGEGVPHSVEAQTDSKVMLIKIKAQ